MNAETLKLQFQYRFLKTLEIFRSSSVVFYALTLLISTSTNASAVCQTPQFGLPIVLNVTRPVAAATGDFNRDGNIDVAVLKNDTSLTNPGSVEVFLSNGNGVFTSTGIQYNATQSTPTDIVTADFNNDGRLDLAVSAYFTSGTIPRGIVILLGNGSGGFSSPSNVFNVSLPGSLAVGDFNNDGKPDIIAKNDSSSTQFASILPGLGNGSFGAAIDVPTDGYGYTVGVRDFNSDGFLDFATVNSANPNNVSIRLGNGSFIFTAPSSSIALSGAVDSTINDFNRDGRLDILVARQNVVSGSNASLLIGVGNGTFTTPSGSPFALTNTPQSVTSADFNSDNVPDAAFGNTSTTNSLSILLNNGTGGFSSAFNLSPETGASARIYSVDFNANGTNDLIIVKETTQNKVVALPNLCAPSGRAKFDFDGDNKSDVSVFRPSNGSWYLLQSTAGFTGLQFGISTDKLAPADYDGDGKTDVAVVRNGNWYLNRSAAGFTGISFGDGSDIPVPADFDGDGKAELAIFRPSNGYWYVYNLASNQSYLVPFGANIDAPVPADYDGDGKADIAVYRYGVWYVLRSQLGYIGVAFGDTADKPVPADYDGDGKADFAVFRPSNGSWYLQRSQLGFTRLAFGLSTDAPVPADYDGDGKADIAVFRSGNWYLNRSSQGFTGIAFGASTDLPIPNAFVRQ